MFAVIFVLLGLPGLYLRLSQSMNIAGVLSLPLLFVGLTLADQMHCPLEFGAMPAIYKVAPDKITEIYQGFNDSAYGTLGIISGPLVMFGVLLFLVGVWCSRELPSWPRWLLLSSLLAMLATLAGMPHGGVLFTELFYASFIAYGALMMRPTQRIAQP